MLKLKKKYNFVLKFEGFRQNDYVKPVCNGFGFMLMRLSMILNLTYMDNIIEC